MQLTKPELREQLKAKRLALSESERRAKSLVIVDKLVDAIDWSQVKKVHCFAPIESLGEVDVLQAFDATNKNHIKVNNIYIEKKIDGRWQTTTFKGSSIIPDQYDVIIVPMLGFDKTLNRVGYGGGFYDKFLATQPDATKIGVCFEAGRIDRLPIEPHDIKMDKIISE